MSAPLWDLNDVELAGRHRPRLSGVTLPIRTGRTAVIGYSGAGKTSLLNLLVGFERPTAGNIVVNLPSTEAHGWPGLDRREAPVARSPGFRKAPTPATPPTSRARLPLYWVPQNDGLWPHLTAGEHLAAVWPDSTSSAAGQRELLQQFDLADNTDARPYRLSQGERSRLSVARALASGAAMLVMDEPLVHVDPARVAKYWEAIDLRLDETGASLVLATHSPEDVLRHATHVVCLKDGRVVHTGPVRELYDYSPSQELAEFLGPANWFAQDEATEWLGESASGSVCYRPERIAVETQTDGPLIVQSTRFAGSIEEVELLHEPTGTVKRCFHRPPADKLQAGDRVWLRVLTCLLFAFLFTGCEHADDPMLPVQSIEYWAIPRDGSRIPAPRNVAVGPENTIYALDNAARVLVYDADSGECRNQWNMPEGEAGNPEGLCLLADGRLAIADTHYHRIVFFTQQGELAEKWGEQGDEPGEFFWPVGIAQDAAGYLYVSEYGGEQRVQKLTVDGEFVLQFGGSGTEPGRFQRPSGVAWHRGKVYVADAINNRIQVFSENGEFLQVFASSPQAADLQYPYDVCPGPADDLFVVEYRSGRVSRFGLDGRLLGRFGQTGRGEGEFSTPWGLTVDAQGRVIVADTGNRRIVELRL